MLRKYRNHESKKMYFFAAKQCNKTNFAEKLGHMPRYTHVCIHVLYEILFIIYEYIV